MSRAHGVVLVIIAAACSNDHHRTDEGGAGERSLPSGAGGEDTNDGGSLDGGAPAAGGPIVQTGGAAGVSGTSSSGGDGQGGNPSGATSGCDAGAVCGGSGGTVDEGGAGIGAEPSGAGGTATDGTGGEAGEMQRPPPSCVDGDPCTLDRWNGSACEHSAAPDETPCNDGRICTADDQCVAGACVGRAFSSKAALLGQVQAFGGFFESRRERGLVALLSEHRAVFADQSGEQTELTLVAVENGRVTPLSSARSNTPIAALQLSPWLWVNELVTHVVRLSSDRFVFLGNHQIEVYDVIEDQLVRRSSGVIPAAARYGFPLGAAGYGERLWIGGDDGLSALTISEDGEVGLGQEMPAIIDCHALALAPDGATLYVATIDSFHVLAVDGDGGLTETGHLFDGSHLFNVRANDSWIAVQKMVAPIGHGDIDVLRASDLSTVATFPAAVGAPVALGFALTDTGILLERFGFRGDLGEVYTAEHYTLSAGTAVLQSSLEYRDRRRDAGGIHRELTRPDALGESIALTPVRQIVDLTSSGFSKTVADRQGSFDAVQAVDAERIAVAGTYTSQLVDLSNPASPVAHGMGVLSPAVQPLKLELDERSGRVRMLSPYPDEDILRLPLNQASDEITVFSPNRSGVLVPAGAFTIDGGPSHLFTAWGSLFQLTAARKDEFALRRFGFDRLAAAVGGSALVADAEAVLAVQTDEIHDHFIWRFQVDEGTGNAVLVDSQQDSGTGLTRTSLTWATLRLDGFVNPMSVSYQTGASTSFVVDVKVFGDRAVVLSTDLVSVVRRDGDDLAIDAQLNHGASSSLNPSTLLGFDRDAIYLGDPQKSDGTSALVHVLDARDLTERALYQLAEPAVAMTNAGSTLAFVSANRVFTASPRCE